MSSLQNEIKTPLSGIRARRRSRTSKVILPEKILEAPEQTAAVKERVALLASRDCHILIQGPEGTGKRTIASQIHAHSKLSDAPFIIVNCEEIPVSKLDSYLFGSSGDGSLKTPRVGQVDLADGGTLVLHHVERIPAGLQLKLLRLLHEGLFSRANGQATHRGRIRILATSSKDLYKEVRKGVFLAEFFYRLRAHRIVVPPLSCWEKSELKILIEHLITQTGEAQQRSTPSIDEESLGILMVYPWPGNLREMRRKIEASVTIADDIIIPMLLPFAIRHHPVVRTHRAQQEIQQNTAGLTEDPNEAFNTHVGLSRPETFDPFSDEPSLHQIEARYIAYLLKRNEGHRSRTAQMLGIGRNTLISKIRRYELE